MAIYLDANQFFVWRNFAAAERVALSIVAGQLRLALVVPEIAFEEASAHLARSLAEDVRAYERSRSRINGLFDRPALRDPAPDVKHLVEDWRASVDQAMTILPATARATREGLLREVQRAAPARAVGDGSTDPRATGARDAAIWIDIVQDHLGRGERGHFVTANARDFISSGKLRPELTSDLSGASHDLQIHASTFKFLDLGEVVPGFEIAPADLEARAAPTIRALVPATDALPRAIWGDLAEGWEYGADVKDVELIEVRATRRYAKGSDALTVLNSIWGVSADVWRYDDADPSATHDRREGARFRGSLQIYMPTSGGVDGLIQLVSGRFEFLDDEEVAPT